MYKREGEKLSHHTGALFAFPDKLSLGPYSSLSAAKAANLPMPVPASGTKFFNNLSGITVQLFEQNGDCYDTAFTPAETIQNDGTVFRAEK